MPAPLAFDYAIIRVVPRVDRAEFINAGAILYCHAARYLKAQVDLDAARLSALYPDANVKLVRNHLNALCRVCRGDNDAGPVAALNLSQRFHWLAAPRSTIIQTSPVHTGRTEDLDAVLAHLMATVVRVPGAPAPG